MHIHVANPVITSNDQLSSKRYSGTWLPSSYGSIIIFQAVSKASLEWSPLQSERKGWSFGRVNTGGFERFGLKATLNAFPTWIDLNAATWSHNCKGCKDLWPRAKRKGRWRGNPPQTASTCECFQASSVFREENFYLRRDVKHIIQWNQRSEGKVREGEALWGQVKEEDTDCDGMAQAPGGTHILPVDQPHGFANGASGGLSLCSLGPEQCFQEHRASWAEGLRSDPWGAVALDPQWGGLGLCLWGIFTLSTIQSITPNLLLSILLCSVTLNSILHNGLLCCSPFSSYISLEMKVTQSCMTLQHGVQSM